MEKTHRSKQGTGGREIEMEKNEQKMYRRNEINSVQFKCAVEHETSEKLTSRLCFVVYFNELFFSMKSTKNSN